MNKRLIMLVACAALAVAGSAFAQGDVNAGKQKAAVCAACHGPDGNSINPIWPSLAGLGERYIVRQLQLFKNGDRQDPLMSPQAQALSEQDMLDLAAYFAGLSMRPSGADPELVELGERIWRGGIPERQVPACAACHGPAGEGNPAAAYPRLGGQQAVYLANSLTAYKTGQRISGEQTGIMNDIARQLTEDEIRAVSSFASGLYHP
ncbi:MAG: cytochrome c4 [Xanthomonadaceae bacterium]|nr:cytochrome c4 [Xanthomonadaceae bacterium]